MPLLDNQLLVGLTDYYADTWLTDYFPEECPDDWRFAYYCNDFRGVWLSADFWALDDAARQAQIDAFVEDGEDRFFFVISLPASHLQPAHLDSLAPIADHIACLVLEAPPPEEIAAIDAWLEQLPKLSLPGNVSVQASALPAPQQTALKQLCETNHWSQPWHATPGTPAPPQPTGHFLPVRCTQTDLRELRQSVETLESWMGKTRSAGLFFPAGQALADTALNTRQLAEIMGI